jgi:hypothetical protein
VESIQEPDGVALKPLAADLALADLDNFGNLSTATGKTNRVGSVDDPDHFTFWMLAQESHIPTELVKYLSLMLVV